MSKKVKIAIIVPLCIILPIVVIAIAFSATAPKALDLSEAEESLSQWMAAVREDVLLTDVVIPGAHDSGTDGMSWVAKTQDKSVKQQLVCGTRYLDLRVNATKDGLKIFHGPVNGVDFLPILQDIKQFLQDNPSECVLMDMQHFKGDDCMQKVESAIVQAMGDMLLTNNTDLDDLQFLDSLTMGQARGKAIVFFGNYFGEDSRSTYTDDKPHLFARENDHGTRGDCVLTSYYDGKLNRKASKSYVDKALAHYMQLNKEVKGGFVVLQGQLTDPILIVGPQFLEATHDKNMSAFVDSLANSDELGCINIIMRDFVGARKNRQIVNLNLAKGNFSPEFVAGI